MPRFNPVYTVYYTQSPQVYTMLRCAIISVSNLDVFGSHQVIPSRPASLTRYFYKKLSPRSPKRGAFFYIYIFNYVLIIP